MPGGSQSHLLRASDGHLYVVKFCGNPQGTRVLINEWLACRLASCIGLPTPAVRAITVTGELLRNCPQLRFEVPSGSAPCPPGVHCAIKYLGVPGESELYDLLPTALLSRLVNREVLAGAAVFDTWLANSDNRQFVFRRTRGESTYTAFPIDHGDCFHRAAWSFPELTQFGQTPFSYASRCRVAEFDEWIAPIQRIARPQVLAAADSLPGSWIRHERRDLQHLLANVVERARSIGRLFNLPLIAAAFLSFVAAG